MATNLPTSRFLPPDRKSLATPSRHVLPLYPSVSQRGGQAVKTGRYPKPVKLGPRTTAWRVSDIRALISA